MPSEKKDEVATDSMFVLSTRVNNSELDPSLLLATLNEAQIRQQQLEAQRLEEERPKELSELGKFMQSPELQTTMLKILVFHVSLAVLDMLLTLYLSQTKKQNTALVIVLLILMIMEFAIMSLFPLEIILRANTWLEGPIAYFKAEWYHVPNFLFLLSMALFDLLEIVFQELFNKLSLPLTGFRLIRGFQSLYIYYAILIQREVAINAQIQSEFDEVDEQYNEGVSRNNEIIESIDSVTERIDEMKSEQSKLHKDVITTQSCAWQQFVPPVRMIRFQPAAKVPDIGGVDLAERRRRTIAGLPSLTNLKQEN